jgi:hypothetical protein
VPCFFGGAQIAKADGREIFAFTRDGDVAAQDFAKRRRSRSIPRSSSPRQASSSLPHCGMSGRAEALSVRAST